MEKREGETHCGRCKTYKPTTEFAPSQQRNGGWCRSCHREHYRQERPALPPRACETCGDEISEPLPKQRFCSTNCKQRARYRRTNPKPERACAPCGGGMSSKRRG